MSIDGKVIKQVNSKKTLGVIINENLCWDKQLRTSVKKFQKALACYAELNHLFQLELSPISIKL